MSSTGKTHTTLPKHLFPVLLSRVVQMVEETVKQNLISGFRKCGIYPVNKDQLLQRY